MFIMGTITINVSDDVEKQFREQVSKIYGQGKGVLGKAFTEALLIWSERKEYFDECMKLLEEGMDLDGITYKEREELHARH